MIKRCIICHLCIFHFLKGCSPGYYGLECESKCTGHCKDNEPCNHINGLCDNGCYDGWTGKNCTEGKLFIIQQYMYITRLFVKCKLYNPVCSRINSVAIGFIRKIFLSNL